MSAALRDLFYTSHLPWLLLTLLAYLGAIALSRRLSGHPFALPVLTGSACVVLVLLVTGTPYEVYFAGAQYIHLLIGPVIVALAVPLYQQVARLRRLWWPLTVALLAGSVTAAVSTVALVWLFGGTPETLLALAPKAATMPIALAVVESYGGVAALAAVAVAVTGVVGAMLTGPCLRLLRIQDPVIEGFTLGLSAHAVGTARAMQRNPVMGAFAALAMGLNGILTAVLIPLAVLFARWLG